MFHNIIKEQKGCFITGLRNGLILSFIIWGVIILALI